MSNQFKQKPVVSPGPSQTSGKAIAALVLGLLSFGFSCLTAIPAIIVGFMAIGDINRSQGRLTGKGMAIAGMVVSLIVPLFSLVVIGILVAILMPALQAARGAAQTASQSNNLKQVGIAMHNYHDTHNSFPYVGTDEVPMSWRVALLPYVEENFLYDQFDFSQPADSAVNMALAAQMPQVYSSVLFEHPFDQSPLQVPFAPNDATKPPQPGRQVSLQSMFAGPEKVNPARMAYVIDGTSNTIMLVVVRPESLREPWTYTGADYDVDLNRPAAGLFQTATGDYICLFIDGSVQRISSDVDPQTLANLMTRDDGNPVYGY